MALVLVNEQALKVVVQDRHGYEIDEIEQLPVEDEATAFLKKESNVHRMEMAFGTYNRKAIKLMASQDPNTVEREVFSEVVHIHQHRFYGCLSLPFSFCFFLLFAQSSFLHEDITAVFVIESGLRGQLSDGAVDIQDIDALWKWMNGTLVDNMFTQSDQQGKLYDDKSLWGRVLTYNQLTGPLVLETQRSKTEMCAGAEVVTDMLCYPSLSQSKEPFGRNVSVPIDAPCDTTSSNCTMEYVGGIVTRKEREEYYSSSFKIREAGKGKRRLRNMRFEYMSYLPGTTVANGDAFRAYLYPNTPVHLVRNHINYLYQKGWLDKQTKQCQIKGLFLNSEVGRPRLEQMHMTFKFSRAGGIFFRIQIDSIFMRFWSGIISMGVDFVWFVSLCFITFIEVRSLLRARSSGGVYKKLKTLWSFLQWTIILLGWLIVLCLLNQQSMLTTMSGMYRKVVDAQIDDIPADTNALGAELHDQADWLSYFNSYFRILIAEYHLILMIRFFTAFHAQPRLGVVTSTLEVSLIDIVHFLIVVAPTFMAYAVAGCFIFGRRIEDFSTFDGALGVCFKILMETEYEWYALTEEHWWTAAIWTWTFMFLLAMLMLNMVLAIVLDVYTEMRKKSGQSETVWVTCYNMVRQLIHRREWIYSEALLEKAPMLPARFGREHLMQIFPSMCEFQCNMLMDNCRYQTEVDQGSSTDIANDAMKMAMAVKLIVDKVNDTTQLLYEGTIKSGHGAETSKSWIAKICQEMTVQNHMMLSVQWQLKQLEWQWQAIEAVHGEDVKFEGKPDAPATAPDKIL